MAIVMSSIRADWLARMEAAVESFSDDLTTIDVRDSIHLQHHFIDTLERPPDALHGAVISTMLMDVCGRIVHTLHEQNPRVVCTCDKDIWAHVGRDERWRSADPRPSFKEWIGIFFNNLETNHPTDMAVRVAQAIRREPQRIWTLDALAEVVATRPALLNRDFEARFGIRPIAYVHLVRTTRAIPLLRSPATVESVARDVGYRSKKDLYAALSRWADATPGQLRALSEERSTRLERQLKFHCLRGFMPAAVPATGSARIVAAAPRVDRGRGDVGRRPAARGRRGSRGTRAPRR